VDDLDAIAGIGPTRIEQTARPRDPVRRAVEQHWPSLLVGSACAGLTASNVVAVEGVALVMLGLLALAFLGGCEFVGADIGELDEGARYHCPPAPRVAARASHRSSTRVPWRQ
jgi:hypothetical protein